MTTRVSVVIPCFNHGEFLPDAVASVLGAKRDDVELIVVDDGSTDGRTRTEIDALSTNGIRVIRQENKGLAAARNVAIAASSGEYILPLDADNRVRPAYFERGISILQTNPKVGVVYGDAQYFGERTDHWRVGTFDWQQLMCRNYIDACALYRRSIWEEAGGYDGRMPVQGYEDWDLWLTAAENGWQFSYIAEVLFDYRVRDDSMLVRGEPFRAAVETFLAQKHGLSYRQVWLAALADRTALLEQRGSLMMERESVKWTLRNLRRLLAARIRTKLDGRD